GTTTANAGTLQYTAGGYTGGGNLLVGNGAGTSGTFTMSGTVGTVTFSGAFPTAVIGQTTGTGTLNVNAGTFATSGANGDLIMASSASGASTTGTVSVNGGNISLAGTNARLIIGDAPGASAIATLTSGTISSASTVFNGGTGQSAGETGTFNLDGGTLT